MALVVFLRGVNVGGHKTFRPSVLAKDLSEYDVVNVGAGSFVVSRPPTRAKLLAELRRRLPFVTEIVLCEGHDIVRIEEDNPFGTESAGPEFVRFLTILAKAVRVPPSLPVAFPPDGQWLVRVIALQDRFVFGVYRRHMKTIGYLGQIDKLFKVPVTTRNWNTITSIARMLKKTE